MPRLTTEHFGPPAIDSAKRAAWAWTAFWEEQNADSRCLANAHPDVRSILDDHWAKFGASLAPSSEVLDIGCGAGIVGRILLRARSDLRVTGIDLARVAPASEQGLCLMPETAMEELPFEDQRFDAAVSQFGFEYGCISRSAKEAARVLAPGASFSFVVHHADSPIVRDDGVRYHALRTVLDCRVEHAFLTGMKAELDHQLEVVRRHAPYDSLVNQVSNALRAGLGRGHEERQTLWRAILEALAPERELIVALESSCVAPENLDDWLAKISGPLEISKVSILRRPNGDLIGWTIDGTKPAIAEITSRWSSEANLRTATAN